MAWIAYEMYFKVTDQYNEKWQYDWITSDFWCATISLFPHALLSHGMPVDDAQKYRVIPHWVSKSTARAFTCLHSCELSGSLWE